MADWQNKLEIIVYRDTSDELFSKNALSAIPGNKLAMPMPNSKIVLWKRAFDIIYMRINVHIYEELFSKTLSPNLALQHRFLAWPLTRFGKEIFKLSYDSVVFIYLFTFICIFIYSLQYFGSIGHPDAHSDNNAAN